MFTGSTCNVHTVTSVIRTHYTCLRNLCSIHIVYLYIVGFRLVTSLIKEIVTDSYSSMEVNGEALVTVSRKFEKLEIQSNGINLCFIEKRTETEDEGFISDILERALSSDNSHIFGKKSSIQHEPYMPLIQEIDSKDDADLCKQLLAHSSITETDLHMLCSVNVDSSEKLMKQQEDAVNCIVCKFYSETYFCCIMLGKQSCKHTHLWFIEITTVEGL